MCSGISARRKDETGRDGKETVEREDELMPHGESRAFVSRGMNEVNVLERGMTGQSTRAERTFHSLPVLSLKRRRRYITIPN